MSLLVGGASTPNIVTLAGEDRADAVEVAAYLDASLRELGLAPLTRDDAACLLMEELAVDLLERRVDAARFADSVLRIADPRLQSLPSGAAGFALDIQYPVSLSEVYGEPPDRVYALAEEYLAWRGRPWSGRPAGRAPSG